MECLCLLALAVLKYAWLEYSVHRWDMHRKGSLRYRSHAVEHHGSDDMGEPQASLMQSDVAVGFWYTLPVTLAVSCLWSPAYLLAWATVCFWAGFAWTAVHRNIHGEPGYWYAWILCPWLPIVRSNHLLHHRFPRTRYGGMFWFLTDPIAGTWKVNAKSRNRR